MKIKKSELNKYQIRYTVELNNLNSGTITVVGEGSTKPGVNVGDFERNVQFKDQYNNEMGCDGYVEKILKTEVFNQKWIECSIED